MDWERIERWLQTKKPDGPASLMYAWESQARQYPRVGKPGIGYYRGDVGEKGKHIDCLLFRDEAGKLLGVLNHYGHWFYTKDPHIGWTASERPGNVNVWVDPEHKREGIATALLEEALRLWDDIDLTRQRYSEEGLALVQAITRKHL